MDVGYYDFMKAFDKVPRKRNLEVFVRPVCLHTIFLHDILP